MSTTEVRIENCTFCNYQCIICPNAVEFTRKKEIMSDELFSLLLEKVYREAPYITTCTISGFGEPFLDKGIVKKIMFARHLGYKVHIVTNGSLLYESLIDDLLNMEVNTIRYSFHTMSPITYMNFTHSTVENYRTVYNNIMYAVKHKGKTRIVVTAQTFTNHIVIEDLRREFENVVDLLEVWKPHNWINTYTHNEGKLVKRTCGRPFNGPIQIQVDGTINMCCFDYNGLLLLGDLRKQGLKEIFRSNEYKEITKAHEKDARKSKIICSTCDQLMDNRKNLMYSSKFAADDRVGRTSTIYNKL